MKEQLIIEALSDALNAQEPPDNLLRVLRQEPSLAIFDGLWQVLGDRGVGTGVGGTVIQTAIQMDYNWLARWLMHRGREVGVAQAVSDLNRYVSAEEIPYVSTLVIAGIEVETPTELGYGIRLLPWDALPQSVEKMGVRDSLGAAGFRRPTAAFVRNENLPKPHMKEHETAQPIYLIDDRDLRDAILCSTLIGPSAPHVVARRQRLCSKNLWDLTNSARLCSGSPWRD